jgi:hypothetical protein
VTDEQEFQEHKRDFLAAAGELGLALSGSEVEEKLRNVQARAQEHDVSMREIERQNLRRIVSEPVPPENEG